MYQERLDSVWQKSIWVGFCFSCCHRDPEKCRKMNGWGYPFTLYTANTEWCVVVAAATLCYLYMEPRPGRAQYSVRLETKAATGPTPGKCGANSLYSAPVTVNRLIPLEEAKISWAASPGKTHTHTNSAITSLDCFVPFHMTSGTKAFGILLNPTMKAAKPISVDQ